MIMILLTISSFSEPYFKLTDYIFDVKYTNAEGLASIELHSVDNRVAGKLDSIQWVFKEYKVTYLDQSYCIQDSNKVMITPPRRGVFSLTENIPNPQINLPPVIGDSIFVEQPLSNGKTMKGYLKVTEIVKYGKKSSDNKAWKIEAHNLHNKKYSAIFYYNENNGFVYFDYKFDKKEIKMDFTSFISHIIN